jgi:uncharacterized SAM-binding protein YcdF (DUF218 family)
MPNVMIPAEVREDVETLWVFHDLQHEPRQVDVCIGLGGHDLGVAEYTAELYHQGLFRQIVFTGANAPTTVDAFPEGEALGYRDHAIASGVPAEAVLVEPEATNTSENLEYSRNLLVGHGVEPTSVLLVSHPYQQRRAFATSQMVWPDVDVLCVSRPQTLDEYVAGVGDADRVVDMLVGETQRLTLYAELGFISHEEDVPGDVIGAFDRLVAAGYTSRLVEDRRPIDV